MQLKAIQQKIFEIRGQKVMPDFDLSSLYKIETYRLKEAVRRNINRFPTDFMFGLTMEEYNFLRTQIASSNRGGRRYRPFAFTEHGVAMLASVLKSEKAALVNIAIVRAFIALKDFALNYKELAEKIMAPEQKYNRQFEDVYEVMEILAKEKRKTDIWTGRNRIGYKKK